MNFSTCDFVTSQRIVSTTPVEPGDDPESSRIQLDEKGRINPAVVLESQTQKSALSGKKKINDSYPPYILIIEVSAIAIITGIATVLLALLAAFGYWSYKLYAIASQRRNQRQSSSRQPHHAMQQNQDDYDAETSSNNTYAGASIKRPQMSHL